MHTVAASGQDSLEAPVVKDWLWAFAQQSLDYAILLVGLDKRVLWASPGAAWILAATSSEITSGPITRFFTAGDVEFGIPEQERQIAMRQGSSLDDRWMLRADGSPFWATGRTVAVAQRDGTPLGYVKIFRDMTDMRMRVAALGNKSPAASSHAAGSLAASSHAASAAPPPTRDADVELHIESLLLAEELQAALASAQQVHPAGNRRVDLMLPPGLPLTFDGDRSCVQQIFAALIRNALKFTADDGHLWISGTVEDGQVVARIEDNGIGIDKDTLQSIYAILTRAPAQTAGFGAGLTRVRNLVELHGGSMQARSAGPGKGSEFTVRLPMRQAARPTTAQQPPEG